MYVAAVRGGCRHYYYYGTQTTIASRGLLIPVPGSLLGTLASTGNFEDLLPPFPRFFCLEFWIMETVLQ